jgi:hypothetical protein
LDALAERSCRSGAIDPLRTSQCGGTGTKFVRASLLFCGDVFGDEGRIVADTREQGGA